MCCPLNMFLGHRREVLSRTSHLHSPSSSFGTIKVFHYQLNSDNSRPNRGCILIIGNTRDFVSGSMFKCDAWPIHRALMGASRSAYVPKSHAHAIRASARGQFGFWRWENEGFQLDKKWHGCTECSSATVLFALACPNLVFSIKHPPVCLYSTCSKISQKFGRFWEVCLSTLV
jgi:hypothetical protein